MLLNPLMVSGLLLRLPGRGKRDAFRAYRNNYVQYMLLIGANRLQKQNETLLLIYLILHCI